MLTLERSTRVKADEGAGQAEEMEMDWWGTNGCNGICQLLAVISVRSGHESTLLLRRSIAWYCVSRQRAI